MSKQMHSGDATISRGATTLLQDCVGLRSGESLLLVEEPEHCGFYDRVAPRVVAETATRMGADVKTVNAPQPAQFQRRQEDFLATLCGFDHVVFFSRIGDQIRFSRTSELPDITMVYALGSEMLESNFGTACHHGMLAIKQAIDASLLSARHIKVTCPLGTHIEGLPSWQGNEANDVSIKRFPMLVPLPVPCHGMHGTVVISRFLVGTGSRAYDPYTLWLENDVEAQLKNNRIIGFSGPKEDVKKVQKHYQHVSSLFNIDPMVVHSWHAGIHPGCSYDGDAAHDLERWSSSAFGNPRLLHMHTCGDYAPGEISWNITDPTIIVDDIALWEKGQLYPQRLPACQKLFDQHPNLLKLFEQPDTCIGL